MFQGTGVLPADAGKLIKVRQQKKKNLKIITLCQPAHVGNTLKLLCIRILVEMFTLLNMYTKSNFTGF